MGLCKRRRSQAQHQGFEGRRLLPHKDDFQKKKTAGQSRANNRNDMPFQCLDMVKWVIICEAVALMQSGELDKLDDGGKNGR